MSRYIVLLMLVLVFDKGQVLQERGDEASRTRDFL